VAVGGWIVNLLVLTVLVYMITPLLNRGPSTTAQGLGVFVGFTILLGLASSPIAGVASVLGHSRANVSPPTGA
jgi:hypothetical protein